MSRLQRGALRHRLTLETPVETADLAGGVVRSFTPLATLWAAIEPVSDQLALVADARLRLATHRITIRWRADITAAQRLTLGSRIFVLLAVRDPEARRQRLVLTVEEQGA